MPEHENQVWSLPFHTRCHAFCSLKSICQSLFGFKTLPDVYFFYQWQLRVVTMSINIFCLEQTLAGKQVDREESRKKFEQSFPGHIQYSRDASVPFHKGTNTFHLKTPCLIYSRVAHTLFMVILQWINLPVRNQTIPISASLWTSLLLK